MENPLVFFLFYLEEGIALAFLGLALIGIRPGIKKIVTAGTLQAIMIYLTRNFLPVFHVLPFAHTILLLVALIVILRFAAAVVGWNVSCAASMLSFLCLFTSELAVLPLFFSIFNLTQDQVDSSLWLHILAGYTGDLLLFALAITVAVTGFSIAKFREAPR